MHCDVCPLPALPPVKKKGRGLDDVPEHRPRRRGEASEARRLEIGFRLLEGEGVYSDDEDDE